MPSVERLLYKLSIGQCTDAEKAELRQWADGKPERTKLLERLNDPAFTAQEMQRFAAVNTERPLEDMRRRLGLERRRRFSWKYIAAAVVLGVLLAGNIVVFLMRQRQYDAVPEELRAEAVVPVLSDIKPGVTRAIIKSEATGEEVELGASDTIPSLSIQLAKATIQPTLASADVNELCLDVPRGAEFKIILEDSTEVWLNSESTLRYPETFEEGERRVHLSGEAYFSVRHDEKRPFYVDTREQSIRVYGTDFNVRVYDDDPYVYTTLERGSVSICRLDGQGGEVMLSPGLQARLDRDKLELDLRKVNTTDVTSWRNKRFVFEEQPLSAIMRDLARWYDFEYQFATPDLEQIVFKGSIPRYTDFVTACSLIELSGGIRFSVDGDGKVLVSAR